MSKQYFDFDFISETYITEIYVRVRGYIEGNEYRVEQTEAFLGSNQGQSDVQQLLNELDAALFQEFQEEVEQQIEQKLEQLMEEAC